MSKKSFFLPVIAFGLLGLMACSEDTTTETPSAPDVVPPVVDENIGGTTGAVTALPSVADPNVPAVLYNTWKAYHYVTIEDEMVYYPSLGSDFSWVFPTTSGAARVVWSTSTEAKCTVSDATVPNMKRRGCTVSEGIGYGMMIAAIQNDVETFNRLWAYNKAQRVYWGTQLMPWLTLSFHYESLDQSSATDADLDIAASLIIMYQKTGVQDYKDDALVIAKAIWDEEVNPANLLVYSGNTSMWRNDDPAYNLSYFSPAAFKLFAMYDPTHDWNGVVNAMYDYMLRVQAAGTGVFPDWSNTAGVAVNPGNGSADKTYWLFDKESVRIPWRIAWDYHWNQDERAAQVLNKLNEVIVARTGGDPLQMTGTSISWDPSLPDSEQAKQPTQWTGAWCLTGMAGNQAWLDACTAYFNSLPMQTTASSYFSNILQMMYSQLLNGLYTKNY